MQLNTKMQRNIFAATTLILLLLVVGMLTGVVPTPGAAGGAKGTKGVGKDKKSGKDIVVSDAALAIDPVTAAGLSVVGSNLVAQGLTIEQSAGNDVVRIQAEQFPAAFGANLNGVLNVINACAIPGGGLADLGSGTYLPETKKHEYVFEFAQPVKKFQIGVLDWGDFMPFGACPDGYCSMVMTAYAGDVVVATAEKGFHTTGEDLQRNTDEYGALYGGAGDACMAAEGQPGRFVIGVNGRGITKVTLNFANQQSMDPNVALWLGPMVVEKDGCFNFLALSTDANKTFDFSGTADVQFCGGGVWSNNTGESSNNSVPSTYPGCVAPTFTSTNDWKKPDNLTGAGYSLTSKTGNVLADPITAAPPAKPGSCAEQLGPGTVDISGVQCYKGLRVGPGETLIVNGVTNDAVLYIAGSASIQGTFQVNNALIFTEGDFDMNSQSDSNLTPNLSGGPWHGFMLWTLGSQKTTINGGSNSNWTGTFYSPNAGVVINGGSDSILRSTVIGKTIDFAGNNNTVTYCDPSVNFVSIP